MKFQLVFLSIECEILPAHLIQNNTTFAEAHEDKIRLIEID